MRRVATVVVLGVALVAGPTPAMAAAKPLVKVGTTSATVQDDRKVAVTLTCASTSKTCQGRFRIRVAGLDHPLASYSIAKKATKTYTVTLTAAQRAKIPAGGSLTAQLRVTEDAPAKVATRSLGLVLKRPADQPAPPTESYAYRERNWTPTSFDTCPASLHKKHSVVGADRKIYPTWHGPTDTDPATGKTCTYGHEHGDDPTTSDLYDWVTDFLDDDPAQDRGIPFGFVSEALDTYASSRDKVTRHEDNVGHKIIVANDVKMVARSPRGYVKDAAGAIVTCDFLIKIHQGSHSADALTNNAHELLYAMRCTDGTELISSTLTRFGNANEFERSCDPSTKIQTSGSSLPNGFGGERLIPDLFCVNRDVLVPAGRSSSVWSLYEVWKSVNRIQTDDGTTLASFDPWFAVRNPARAHRPGLAGMILDLIDTTWMVDESDGGTAKGYPWDEVHEHHGSDHLAKQDPDSPFNGAQRDYYLGQTEVRNAGGGTVWFSDPYGDHAVTTPGPGLVRQWVGATSNASWPELERRQFDLERDYGHGNGVHAPN